MPLSRMELFRLRHATKNNYREAYISDTKDIIESRFADDPAFRQVEVVGRGNIEIRASNYRKEGYLTPKMDVFSTLENEFFMGDIFFFDDDYWLCTMKQNFYNVYFKGELVQCNNFLRFQIPNQYTIYEIPVNIERPYSKSLTSNEIVQVSSKEYRVRLQLNDITKRLFLRQRFIIGVGYDKDGREKPDVYRIEARDPLSNAMMLEEGFLVLTIKEDEYIPSADNKSLLIANYRALPNRIPLIKFGIHIISPDDNYEIRMGNPLWKVFVAKLFDENCKEITNFDNISFHWSVIDCEPQHRFLVFDTSGRNVIKVRCNLPHINCDVITLLNSEFELVLTARDDTNDIDFHEFRTTVKIIGLV